MRRFVLLACVCLLGPVGLLRAAGGRVEIILDVSGSMKASMGTQSKIDAAKTAIRQTIAGLQPESVVALRFYGHRTPQDRKAESCRDTELVMPFQPLDKARMVAALDKAVPRGQTPISYSLDQAAADFGAASDEERGIILVSDGEETCGGDPLATVRDLAARGIKVKVHTIGFDVDAAARQQLQAISQATGGEYHDAQNAAALATSLQQLTAQALLVTRDSAFGQETRGGNTYDDAVPIQPGTVYRLDHHQRKSNYDYFVIDVHDGQKIVASIQSYTVGVFINGDSFQEGGAPYAGFAVHGPNKQAINDKLTGSSPGDKVSIEVPVGAGQGGRYYLLVGNPYTDQHKNARFELQLVDISDAKSGRDAGGDESGAIDLQPGVVTGDVSAGDMTDMYAFKVSPGIKYSVRVKPNAGEKQLALAIIDRDGVVKKEGSSPNGGAAVRLEDLDFPYDGKAFVRVDAYKYANVPLESQYALELTVGGGAGGSDSGAPAAAAPAGPGGAAAAPGTPAPAGGPAQTPPTLVASKLPMIGLGVVGVVILIGLAYWLGRSAGARR